MVNRRWLEHYRCLSPIWSGCFAARVPFRMHIIHIRLCNAAHQIKYKKKKYIQLKCYVNLMGKWDDYRFVCVFLLRQFDGCKRSYQALVKKSSWVGVRGKPVCCAKQLMNINNVIHYFIGLCVVVVRTVWCYISSGDLTVCECAHDAHFMYIVYIHDKWFWNSRTVDVRFTDGDG